VPAVDTDRYRVDAGQAADLAHRDPSDQSLFNGGKKAGKTALTKLNKRLEDLQELFHADSRHRLLVVLQATDSGGKDGTIRSVFDGVNPLGVKVASFKKPTEKELAHDYLWRIHPHVPGNGEITIFNRSHYEDVLVVRVHNLVPELQWRRRYQQIVDFERLLVEEGTTILKFFLHISKDEQRERLQDRVDDPEKHWKFSLADLDERKRWDDYQAAFEEAISRTSTGFAPWYVIPANRKWYRNIVVAKILIETLESLDLRFPPSEEDLTGVMVE
jgi:PPK2 family polyphosphate:nucleotide phosphotransferase